ncbi:MAG: hypothetical protein MJZ94_01095 [Bacteroidales bacterium]|nr:hypothetical protein [Bacteroidales bacterium]
MINLNATSKKWVSSFDLWFWEKLGRNRYVNRMADKRLRYISSNTPLSAEQKLIIKETWGTRYVRSKFFTLYSNRHGLPYNLSDYIPDDYYMNKVEPFFNHPLIARKNEDKNLYDLFFPDIRMPETVARQIDGVLLDASYSIISQEELVRLCHQASEVIIKVASESGGGHGISFWSENEDDIVLVHKVMQGRNIIVQKLVHQHSSIAELHPNSINTLRIMTIMYEGQVHVMTHFIRMGIDGKKVDNVSSGGMLCGINEDGQMLETGYDEDGRPLKAHPTSGVVFKGRSIPNFEACLDMVRNLAPRLSHMAKLISWDVAIEEDGLPTLIEANLTYCDIGIYQIACGPVFGSGELKNSILKSVKASK